MAAALAIAACGPSIPPVPGKGGPAWRELTSDHFVLRTDASEERAREIVRDIEDMRHVVIGIAFRGGGTGKPIVIALRDDVETAEFMPGEDYRAMATQGATVAQAPLILISAEAPRAVVAHELTHTISQTVIAKQPRWFAEGLAMYFETIEIHRDEGRVDLGRAPSDRGESMVLAKPLSLRAMVACEQLACADRHFYVAAWALFAYLMNVRHVEVAQILELVAGAKLDELDAEVKRWLVAGQHEVLHFNVRFPPVTVSERALGDADVYAARALMRLYFSGRPDLARTEAQAALALAPGQTSARAVLELASTARSSGRS